MELILIYAMFGIAMLIPCIILMWLCNMSISAYLKKKIANLKLPADQVVLPARAMGMEFCLMMIITIPVLIFVIPYNKSIDIVVFIFILISYTILLAIPIRRYYKLSHYPIIFLKRNENYYLVSLSDCAVISQWNKIERLKISKTKWDSRFFYGISHKVEVTASNIIIELYDIYYSKNAWKTICDIEQKLAMTNYT